MDSCFTSALTSVSAQFPEKIAKTFVVAKAKKATLPVWRHLFPPMNMKSILTGLMVKTGLSDPLHFNLF